MTGYLLRRALASLPTLLLVMGVMFLLLQGLPGDPAEVRLGGEESRPTDRAAVEHLRREFGLDRSVGVQALDWVRRCVLFDFGLSFSDRSAVGPKVARALWATAVLNGSALLLLLVCSLFAGLWLAVRSGTFLERGAGHLLAVLSVVPAAWGALLLQRFLAVDLGWFPLLGAGPAGAGSGEGLLAPRIAYLCVPVLAFAYRGTALYTLLVREAFVEALHADHVMAARARGLPTRLLYLRHALGAASRTLITTSAPLARALVAGNVVIESVFAWPGAGRLLVESVLQRDYPVLMALTWISILFTLGWILLADLILGWVDPRLRLHDSEGAGV
ncbi:MAG: ABC transporter permease [Acidobacteriota bacterium]|nr:ABC transporter permease [Acidobacteriota bacterium]